MIRALFFRKKSLFFVLLVSFCTFLTFAAEKKVPDWFEHKELVFPSEFYISAIGEGLTKEEAEIKAISQISLFFNTTSEVSNDLLKKYSESEYGKNYYFSSSTQIQENSKITSSAEFFCVQFDTCFYLDGKYYTLAFIERNAAFDVYNQQIKINTSILENLLLTAEDYNNPILGLEAAEQGVLIADLTSELVKMARIVKRVSENYFLETENYIQRIYSALEICKKNLVFTLTVENDYEDLIYLTLSDLLENNGYSLSKTDGVCSIPVKINVDKEENSAGIFLYCGISIEGKTGTGQTFFSYSRTFPKKGAKQESFAYKRAFLEIQNELNRTFIQEFNAKVKN